MTCFRILYLAEGKEDAFRTRAPGKPPYLLRKSHYEEGPEIIAESPYDLWEQLRTPDSAERCNAPRPVGVGDALESGDRLLLCNFWGFDQAAWHVAEKDGRSAGSAPEPTQTSAAEGRLQA